jgi:hypothetical protein
MNDDKKYAPWVELLKYPITIFSLLLALVAAKSMLGLPFGQITEFGPGGLKFAHDAKAEIADLAGKLNGAMAEIEALKKATPEVRANSDQGRKDVFAASQTVSDQTAALSNVVRDQTPTAAPLRRGYIWIGDFNNGNWGKTMLGSGTRDEPVKEPPISLALSATYTTLGNIVVRDGLPSNDVEYFRARASLGVIPRGTSVRLVNAPVAIDRQYAVQYWAQIEWK